MSFDYSYDATLRSIEGSLRRLGRATVDFAFIHDIDPYNHGAAQPDVFRAAMEGAWRALAALRDAGVVRAIGVGVNDVAVCEACLAAADIDCFLLAGRYTLLDTAALPSLLPACERRGVGVVLGAPFNTGLLARGAAADTTWNHQAPPEPVRRRVAAIERVGLEHGVVPDGGRAAVSARPSRHRLGPARHPLGGAGRGVRRGDRGADPGRILGRVAPGRAHRRKRTCAERRGTMMPQTRSLLRGRRRR